MPARCLHYLFSAFLLASLSPLGAEALSLDPASSTLVVHAYATGHHFDVVPEHFAAAVEVDAGGHLTSAHFEASLSAFHTGNKHRDEEMLSWAESPAFPLVTFDLESVDGPEAHSIAHGTLQLHGITRPVDIPFTLAMEDGHRVLHGSATVDYERFGLEKIRKFFLSVKPELEVEFTLVEAAQ